ncbi:MAG: hypothetical protein EXR78_05895 [Deltaproteobacteria bacterium]|nr:hypothetical protein [Deltaproteobacteria bacterium]
MLDPVDQWIPSENVGEGTGGCQTPIGTLQVFDRTAAASINSQTGAAWTPAAKQQLEALIGTNVWEHARTLFAKKNNLTQVPQPLSITKYDGDSRRAAVAPTSK